MHLKFIHYKQLFKILFRLITTRKATFGYNYCNQEMFVKHEKRSILKNQPTSKAGFEIIDTNFIARLAQSEQEVDEALKLRFEVFNLELNEGLQSSYLSFRDRDQFDEQCDHLIIVCRKTNRIIGTYRLQTYTSALKGIGFYSRTEFELHQLPQKILKQSVELGRACIHKDFRHKKVLFLLWCGIARYAMMQQQRYLFGCCSLTSQNPAEGHQLYKQLEQDDHIIKDMCIPATTDFFLPPASDAGINTIKYPPLFSMYLRYGAKIISAPAIDKEFNTIDYLILLDIANISPVVQKLFFTLPESNTVYCPPPYKEMELL